MKCICHACNFTHLNLFESSTFKMSHQSTFISIFFKDFGNRCKYSKVQDEVADEDSWKDFESEVSKTESENSFSEPCADAAYQNG